MGDRYYIKLDCAYCGKENPKSKNDRFWEDGYLYYAESSGFTTFKCDYCGRKNKIIMDFKAVKLDKDK